MKKVLAGACFLAIWTVGVIAIDNRRIAAVERRSAANEAHWLEQSRLADHQAVEMLTEAEESCAKGTLTTQDGLRIIQRVVEGGK